jgi:hypothetical protein
MLPNFLVIGAGKSGTTALYRYLEQHPEIYMSPEKEPNFFALEGKKANFRDRGPDEGINRWSVTNIEDYRALFAKVSNERAIGEASPLYLYSAKAPERIRHYIPNAKLIAILRNPVERAHSAFTHLVRDGREPFTDFAQALREEEARITANWSWIWHYKEMGFYHAQLRKYFDVFDQERIKVYLYEDLKADPMRMLLDTFRFLGVNEDYLPNASVKYNASGIPKNKLLHSFLMKSHPIKAPFKPLVPVKLRKRIVANLRNRNLREPPQLSPEMRRQLTEVYREDVLKLQELIHRDLSRWLEC